MSAGEWAGLIAALAAALLVLLLAIPLLKLGRVLDETTLALRQTREQGIPILLAVETPAARVPRDLEPVDDVPADAAPAPGHSAQVVDLSGVVAATLGGPLIKAAAYSHGVRSAVRRRREEAAIAELRRARRNGRPGRRTVRRAA